ncbi:hypothetical protein GCM10010413_12820 [Promicromonospora sukumoe]|uniref:Uncharacterized protein n=1 Tax=Promicromonospora sukumoe TaxID=88382 RepID=A0A7W3J616_9MICO|nr:DUF5302 family protein [Promicromonospora sukumoe]MBA8806943.1 hypothetical protein [Promicromonospora sukumoe]
MVDVVEPLVGTKSDWHPGVPWGRLGPTTDPIEGPPKQEEVIGVTDEKPNAEEAVAQDAEAPKAATAPSTDAKARFKEALDRKNAARGRTAAGDVNTGAVHGSETTGPVQKMFRRKSG